MADIHTFNQFQQELENRRIDPQVAYMLSVLYERMTEISKQVDMCATVVNAMASQMQGFVALHERTQQGLLNLERFGKVAGVDVSSSVLDDPSKKN